MATKTAAKKASKSAPAKKAAPKKAAPAKKAAAKKAAPTPKKAAAKPAVKPKAKAAKPAEKKAAKPAAKPAAKEKAATGKAASGKAEVKKPAPKKKLNVGQKPRSDRVIETPQRPIGFGAQSREGGEALEASKATPASKEAKQNFKVNDHIVYPAHGVGRIVAVERQHIAGIVNELFVIDFEQEKLKLKVPTAKAISVGMRALSDDATIKKAIDVLKGRARIKRTMWSRRAQEYEAKINSGDVIAVAEVVRDLYRAEVAAVRKSDITKALAELDASLAQKKAA